MNSPFDHVVIKEGGDDCDGDGVTRVLDDLTDLFVLKIWKNTLINDKYMGCH